MKGPTAKRVHVRLPLADRIQACVRAAVDCHVRITNYHKDGSTFANLLSLRPILDSRGKLRFVIGLQCKVAAPEETKSHSSHGQQTWKIPSRTKKPDKPKTNLRDDGQRTTAELIAEKEAEAKKAKADAQAALEAALDPASRRQLEWQQRVFFHLPKKLRASPKAASPVLAHLQKDLKKAASKEHVDASGPSASGKGVANSGKGMANAGKGEQASGGTKKNSVLSSFESYALSALIKESPEQEARRKVREAKKEEELKAASIAKAAQEEVLVKGASWMIFGASFAGEHQRMLEQLQTSNATAGVGAANGSSDGDTKHAHVIVLTLLSWLQPLEGASALMALFALRPASKAIQRFITRACPRLAPSLEALVKRLRGGVKEEITIQAPSEQKANRVTSEGGDETEGEGRTLEELLGDRELLLGWAEFLASERCLNLMQSLFPPPKSAAEKEQDAMLAKLMKPSGDKKPSSASRAAAGELKLVADVEKKGTTWLGMFSEATRKLPHAILVVDMRVAGLPLVSVNDAFVQLTGYSQNEAVGHNCRFLQGSATEDSSVAELVRSIRERTACVVKITNYRKDGVSFVNELSLHPIFDSRGIYRYVVGVASNASETSAPIERALLVALRQLIPTHFPAALNGRNERRVTSFDVLNVEFQYEEAALQLARVACCNDMRGSMDRLLQHPETSHLVLQALPENERRFRCASAALTSLQNTPSRLCR